jgi:hypothetical protein
MSFAIKVGQVVFADVFGGDPAALGDHGRKDLSFRRLVKDPRLPFSASTLWRYVRIYELTTRFPGVIDARHFGLAHARAVLGLPHDIQERLIRACLRERWSRDDIEGRARAHRGKMRIERSPRAATATLRHLGSVAKRMDVAALEGLRASDVRDLASTRQTMEAVISWCQMALHRMTPGPN